jgi:signal transduction histidine kinase
MQRLVDDLLLLARADSGTLLEPTEIAVRPFVEDLIEGLTPTAKRRFEVSEIPDGVLVGDPDRVAQAVRNLVSNAIEHTAERGLVRIRITAAGGRLELAVEDDGPGIPAPEQERVFDRFHRTDTARDHSSGGAGLGLAIVRAIVKAHGGETEVGSSPEGGARVAFSLPGYRSPRAPVQS